MIEKYLGELAALSVAVFWTVSALSFEKAGYLVGSLSVNVLRIIIAMLFLSVATYFTQGSFLPIGASAEQWFWLGLSGFIGFFLGDLFLFKSYTIIGSRTAALVLSLVPVLTTIISWFVLKEKLSLLNSLGVVVTVLGIAIALLGKSFKLTVSFRGFLYALGGALGQTLGLVLSKKGMGDYDPIAATQIRAVFGLVGFVGLITYLGRWGQVSQALSNRTGMQYISIGAFFGAFLGVALTLYAIQHAQTGIVSTLTSLVPIFILVPSAILFKERITTQQVLGALISIFGVSLLFL